MADINWDKKLTQELMDIGLDWEKARIIVGIVAEERQLADRQGYQRGFENGFNYCKENKNA